ESGATGDLAREEEEMGDLLFAIANLSRKLGVEPEAALRRANEKFTERFDAMERAFTSRKQSLSAATLEEMETEWKEVKRALPYPRRSQHLLDLLFSHPGIRKNLPSLRDLRASSLR